MNIALILIVLLIAVCFIWWTVSSGEAFQLDHYIRPNYESGANMLRGDLPINPVNQSWFNSRYGKSSLAPGFFQM